MRKTKQEAVSADFDETTISSPCYYCGAPASSIDHVPPQTYRQFILEQGPSWLKRYPFVTVDACRECNSLLGRKALWTLRDRKNYIAKKLRSRYKKILLMPGWSKDELSTVEGRILHEFVSQGEHLRQIARERVAWASK